MPNPYVYSISADMPGGAVNEAKLHAEIVASAIATTLNSVRTDMNVLTITFTGDLSAGDKTILDGDTTGPAGGLLAEHDNGATLVETTAARVYSDVNISTQTGIEKALPFNKERWDTDGMHDNSVNNHRITIQTAGQYIISANVLFVLNATGIRQILLKVNGDVILKQSQNAVVVAATVVACSTPWPLVVGDIVEAWVIQTCGSNLDIIAAAKFTPEFSVLRVGD